jgi:pantothenate kinase
MAFRNNTTFALAIVSFLGFTNVIAFSIINIRSRKNGFPLMASKGSLAGDLVSKVKWKKLDAETSANLYMDPATTKIANVTISWEPETAKKIREKELKKKVNEFNKGKKSGKPFMVGVVGIPGSGKSTSSEILSALLSNSIVMPMDGYHFPLQDLQKFDDPKDAIYRRGAPDTFDPKSLENDLERIVNGDETEVSIPGFDHAKGDPEKEKHTFIRDEHSVVICEGIYLMHQDDGWENIKSFFDYVIYITVDVDTCIDRLKERNKCIPGYTPEEIEIRCDAVDRVNAMTVEKSRKYADEEVKSGAV